MEQPQLQDAAAALQYIYILLLLKILNNNEFTIDNGYAAVETHSKSSIIKLLSKLYELVLLQTARATNCKSYRQALAPPRFGAEEHQRRQLSPLCVGQSV